MTKSATSSDENATTLAATRFRATMAAVAAAGLTAGTKGKRVNSRSYEKLFLAAKKKTGLSEAALIDYALAKVVLEDDFGERLLALKGSVSKDLDLDF